MSTSDSGATLLLSPISPEYANTPGLSTVSPVAEAWLIVSLASLGVFPGIT